MGHFSRDAPSCIVAGTEAGDTVSLPEQSFQPIGDKCRNRLISGFEGEKEKCKFDLVDKKWDDIASREGDLCGRVL